MKTHCITRISAQALMACILIFSLPIEAAVPVISSFISSATSVGSVGSSAVRLYWSVSGATQLSIDNGVGDVTGTSTILVSPNTSTVYTLTASNAEGKVSRFIKVNRVDLLQLTPQRYQTEHVLFIIPDASQASFPNRSSVFRYDATSGGVIDYYVGELKKYFPADYMTVVVAANQLSPNISPDVIVRRHIAEGIGMSNAKAYGVPNIIRYNVGNSSLTGGSFALLDDLMGNNWGMNLVPEISTSRWFPNTNASGLMSYDFTDDGYLTVKQFAGDGVKGFTWSQISYTKNNESKVFAFQDLYAMGLNEAFPDTYLFNGPGGLTGPATPLVFNADHRLGYNNLNKYDHASVVAKNGPRVPDYKTSEKQFRLGVVYIARDLAEVQRAYLAIEDAISFYENAEQIDTNKFRFMVPFLVSTHYRGSINARLADLDGNASPTIQITGQSYLTSMDGSASVPFQEYDSDGPMPSVSLVPGDANAKINAGYVDFQGLTAGTHFFTLKAEDSKGKKAFAHFVIDVANATPPLVGTRVQLVSSPNPSLLGQAVAYGATIQGSTPTGSVSFKDGSVVLCKAEPVKNGRAYCTPSAKLTQGVHSITASYSGDAKNAASQSSVLTQTVNAAPVSAGALTSLIINGLSPAFSPSVMDYTIPAPAPDLQSSGAMVTATLGNASDLLYINNTPIKSGTPFNAWLGNGKIEIVVYRNWKEVGRFTVKVNPYVADTSRLPSNPALTGLVIDGLSPAFSASVSSYTIPAPPVTDLQASGAMVTATLGNPGDLLYINSTPVKSGTPFNVWLGNGKVDIVVYRNWKEVGRYDVTVSK